MTTLDDWDTLGMRATQSNTTKLAGAFVPDDRISRFLPVGPNADPFVFAIFANFLLLIGSVYAGIADRALELAVEAAHRRTSLKNGGATYATDPDIRWRIADAALALDALAPDLEGLAADVDGLVDHGADWFRKLTGAKHRATETARHVVDQAMRVAGGGGYALIQRARQAAARCARRHLPPVGHRVGALDGGDEPARARCPTRRASSSKTGMRRSVFVSYVGEARLLELDGCPGVVVLVAEQLARGHRHGHDLAVGEQPRRRTTGCAAQVVVPGRVAPARRPSMRRPASRHPAGSPTTGRGAPHRTWRRSCA